MDAYKDTNMAKTDSKNAEPDSSSKRSLKTVTFAVCSSPKMERQEKQLDQYREMFRSEMKLLYDELQAFKDHCQKEMARYSKEVEQKREQAIESIPQAGESLMSHMEQYERDKKNLLERRQRLIDLEIDLDGREEELAKRTGAIVDYEKQISESEQYLDRRFDIIKHKEIEILRLDKELNELKNEMEGEKSKLHNENVHSQNGKSNATENWDFLKTNLKEKQLTTEASLRRCRNELEASQDENSRLSSEILKLKQDLEQKDKRLKELEKRLSLSLYHSAVKTHNYAVLASPVNGNHHPKNNSKPTLGSQRSVTSSISIDSTSKNLIFSDRRANSLSQSLDFSEPKRSQNWQKLRTPTNNVAKAVSIMSSHQGALPQKHNEKKSNGTVRNAHSQTCTLM